MMTSIDLLKKNYASPEISVENIAVESGFAASDGIGTQELEEESYSIQWE